MQDIAQNLIFLSKHKKYVTLFAISCDQKSWVSYLSISTLSNIHWSNICKHDDTTARDDLPSFEGSNPLNQFTGGAQRINMPVSFQVRNFLNDRKNIIFYI